MTNPAVRHPAPARSGHAGRHPRRRRPADRRGGRAAACRRWRCRISTAAPMPSPLDLEAPAGSGRASGNGCRPALPDPGHPRRRWPRRASRPPACTAFRLTARSGEPFGFMVEARSLRVALNARCRGAQPAGLRPGRPPRWSARPMARRCGSRPAEALRRGWWSPPRAATARCGSRPASAPPALDYHQIGMVGAFAHERPHRNIALEQFLPNGPFAQLPLVGPDNFGTARYPHASAFVWADRRRSPTADLALDDAVFGRELARRLGDHLGAIRRSAGAGPTRCPPCRWNADGYAARADRRCRAWRPPDRRAGPQPRLPRRRRAGRRGDRRLCTPAPIRARPRCWPLPGAAAARTPC